MQGVYVRTAEHKGVLRRHILSVTKRGTEHPHWKGANASYFAKHEFINSNFGKASRCENEGCVYPRKNPSRTWLKEPKRFEWALKHGRDYSHNKEDYVMLCKSCHSIYDRYCKETGLQGIVPALLVALESEAAKRRKQKT